MRRCERFELLLALRQVACGRPPVPDARGLKGRPQRPQMNWLVLVESTPSPYNSGSASTEDDLNILRFDLFAPASKAGDFQTGGERLRLRASLPLIIPPCEGGARPSSQLGRAMMRGSRRA